MFLNPAYGRFFCKSARWFARSRGRVQRHPDYLCQALAVLEEAGHRCALVDAAALNLGLRETLARVQEFRPQMVVIQATTPTILSDLEHARGCKEVLGGECLTVMVGAHPSAEPEDTLRRGAGALDLVARGEYDYTLRDLAAGMDPAGVAGVSRLVEGEVVHNPDRPFIEDLDALPFPAWHHIDPRHYPDAGKLYPFLTLVGGRGCTGRCTFCLFPQVMYGRRYRAMSVERVVAEIEYDLRLFPFLREIMFEDDTLTLPSQLPRLHQLCETILRRGIRISWSANARPDLDDLETLRLMRRAGCRMLCVGFEFGDQELLDRVRKGIRLERMERFAHLAHQAGIRLHGCFMIGGPGETRQSALRTIEFACRLPLETVQFSGVCAYPGTEFYRWARKHGYLVPRSWPQWVDQKGEQRAIVGFPWLPVEEINRLVDLGLRRFYLRPRQVARLVRRLARPHELRTTIHGLKGFVDYFLGQSTG
jgi:radical SAM superfamily enzyme YgiQ (UPF0313 family)